MKKVDQSQSRNDQSTHDQPLISVVIPTYNEAYKIRTCLDSMSRQTYRNLEIIVIDDHSTDTTREIVAELAKADPRISYHLLPDEYEDRHRRNWRGYDINAGYAARNYGFKIARGEWITTQDADDASLLNRIEVQYDLAKKYAAALVTVQWMKLDADRLDKHLDAEKIFKEKGEEATIIRPEAIARMAHENKGVFMMESLSAKKSFHVKKPLHRWIPFPIKWFPYTRTLFYRRRDNYPGADNCMFFSRSVIDDGIYFRKRSGRTWGVPSGRGSGRDFAFRVAYLYENSWSFRLPLYLWSVNIENPDYPNYEKYLV